MKIRSKIQTPTPGPATVVEVFYIGGSTGWAVGRFDAQGNQIDGVTYAYLQRDAVREGRRIAQREGLDLLVFQRDGSAQ